MSLLPRVDILQLTDQLDHVVKSSASARMTSILSADWAEWPRKICKLLLLRNF